MRDSRRATIVLIHSDIREMRWVSVLLKTAFDGAILRQFSDAASALQYLQSKTADVALMESDICCAEGGLLCRAIRERRPEIPIVVISGNGHFAKAEADAQLTMPLNVETLSGAICAVAGAEFGMTKPTEDSVW